MMRTLSFVALAALTTALPQLPTEADLDLALAAIGGVAALHEAEAFDQTEMTTEVEDGSWDANHLFFYALDQTLPSFKRCGEVDAAPYMPKELFLPKNKMALRAYVDATVKLYTVPVLGMGVKLGRCSSVGFTQHGGAVQGISWTSNMMGPVCAARCGCNYQGQYTGKFARNLPYCKGSYKNNPKGGNYCSLCGTQTSCPGCTAGTVVVQLYYQNSADKAKLTHAAALKASAAAAAAKGAAAKQAAYQGLFKKHLYFRLVNTCQGEWNGANCRLARPYTLKSRCGEVDAAPRMPVELFEAKNKAALNAYIKLTIEQYKVVGPKLELGRCADIGYRSPAGSANARWAPYNLMSGVCETQCNCWWGGNYCQGAKTNKVGPINGGCQGKSCFCTLCQGAGLSGPRGSPNPGKNYNTAAKIDFFVKKTGCADGLPPPCPAEGERR